MVKFNSYQKIPESPDHWNLDTKALRQLQRAKWCVTEKIHGANFCWVISHNELLCTKRKAILSENDDFFHYQQVKQTLSSNIRQVFESVIALRSCHRVYVYGELFGGCYPHPDVPPIPQVTAIQTGIYYAPGIEFCGFDIAIENGQGVEYLDYPTAIQCFEQASLLYAKPLLVGTLQEAQNYPIRFTTTIPALLNLPPLDAPNKAEGIVIKPMQSFLVQTPKGPVRPIIKQKIAEFSEESRYHQAEKWQATAKQKSGSDYLLDELEWDIHVMVTENRLNNAISKVGHLSVSTLDDITRLFKEDVEEVLAQKQGDRLLQLTTEDQALIEAVLTEQVQTLIQQRQQAD